MTDKEMQDKILDTIDLMIDKRFKTIAKFNYYIEAKITKKNTSNTYDIDYNDNIIPSVKCREGLSLVVGNIVLVCVVNGNFSNMVIDMKRP